MQDAAAAAGLTESGDDRPPLILVGFSPGRPLAAIARHLGWPGLILSDPERMLYQRLGIGRAPLHRVYSPGTLATYAAGMAHGHKLTRPVEDTRQLGGDAVISAGQARVLWRPASPDDRPAAAEVISAARQWARR